MTLAWTPGPVGGQMPRSSALAGAGRTPGGSQPTLVDGQWVMILPSPSPGPGSFVTHPSTYPKRLGDRLRQGRSNQRPGSGRCGSTVVPTFAWPIRQRPRQGLQASGLALCTGRPGPVACGLVLCACRPGSTGPAACAQEYDLAPTAHCLGLPPRACGL